MSNQIKSSLYFASFIIAAVTYYNVGKFDAKYSAMEKEINTLENQTAITPNGESLKKLY